MDHQLYELIDGEFDPAEHKAVFGWERMQVVVRAV